MGRLLEMEHDNVSDLYNNVGIILVETDYSSCFTERSN